MANDKTLRRLAEAHKKGNISTKGVKVNSSVERKKSGKKPWLQGSIGNRYD